MTAAVAPAIPRRAPQLAPRPRAVSANAQGDDETILQMLRRMTLSQWVVLLYPLFLFCVHRRRDEGDVATIDTSAMIQIGLSALIGMWMLHRMLNNTRQFERIIVESPLRWLLAYAVIAIISASWSASPSLTIFRAGQLLVFLLLVADTMATLRSPQEMIRFQLLFAAIVALFWQVGTAFQIGFSIGSLHSSDIAGVIMLPVFIGVFARGRQWRALHLVLCAALLVATSTGSFFAVAGGLVVTLLLTRGRSSGLGVILLCLMVIVPVIFPDKITSVIFFGKNETAIQTGTGRLPIWQWVIEERVSTCPVLGFGFGQGEVQARLYNIGGFRMMHMHNAFMSALVNLGTVGLAIWAVMWTAMIRSAWRIPTHRVRIVMIGAAVALFLNTISVESVTAPITMPWIGHAMFFTMLAIGQWRSAPVENMTAEATPVRRIAWRPSRLRGANA